MSAESTLGATAGVSVGAVAPGPAGGGLRSRRSAGSRVGRVVLGVLFGLFFLVPLAALIEFSTRAGASVGDGRTLAYWRQIGDTPDIVSAIIASLELALITTVATLFLLLPTMVWVRLRTPRLSKLVELLCLLPLTIPAIVLVVGWAPIYLWVNYFTPTQYQSSPLVLAFAYIILVLPYVYRTLDVGLTSIDVRTLSEAARSLGAGWGTVMLRIITPNIGQAVLNSALLSVAIVLGEFTVAQLLNYVNIQVAAFNASQANAGVSVAVAAGVLIFIFILLLLLSFLGSRRSRARSGGRA